MSAKPVRRRSRAQCRAIYASAKWAATRRRRLDAAGRRCEGCGVRGRLQVHHRVSLREGGDPYAWSNLDVLCTKCHVIRHARANALPGQDEWTEAVASATGRTP